MIDPNEAPGWLIAVPYTSCDDCALADDPLCFLTKCASVSRRDGENVQFVRREDEE